MERAGERRTQPEAAALASIGPTTVIDCIERVAHARVGRVAEPQQGVALLLRMDDDHVPVPIRSSS